MGLLNGKVAKVTVGGDVVGYVSGAELNMETGIDDIKVLGEDWSQSNPNINSWSISVDGYLDATDEGQQALQTAYMSKSQIAVEYFESTTKKYVGNAFVENLKISAKGDGTTEINASIKGDGALTPTAITQ